MRRASRFAANRAALLGCLLLFVSAAVSADPEGVRVLYSSEGGDRPAWSESLAAALSGSPLLDAVIPAPLRMETVEAAARLSCALAVRVVTSLTPGRDAVSRWSVLDPLTWEALASGAVEGPPPTDRELAEYWWIPVVEAAENALPRVKKTLVRIEGPPGAVLEGLSQETLVIPDIGYIDIPLRVPGTYPWRAAAPGSYPKRGYFGALEQGQTLSLSLSPLRRWSLETSLVMLQFPDFWATWRFREDTFFVRFGLSQYLFGVYLPPEDDEGRSSVLLSLPLILPGAGFGVYFLPPDAVIRPYASATVFARLLLVQDAFGFDPIAPVGLTGAGGFEWKAFERAAVFLELGAVFYPFCEGFLLASSRSSDIGGPFGILYGDGWLLELPVLRLGVRFTL